MRDPQNRPSGWIPGSVQGMVDDLKNIRRPALIALTAALAVGVSACGESDPAPGDGATTTSSAAQTSDETSAGETSSGATSETAPASSSGSDTWHTAIEAAEQEADGTAYEIDDQDDDETWEVDVAKGKTSSEVQIAADGTVRGEDDTDLDDDDRAGLAAAKITLVEAIEAALEEADGSLDDAELEEEGGKHFWQVTVDTADRTEVEVRVDVTSGTATVEPDDDNTDDD